MLQHSSWLLGLQLLAERARAQAKMQCKRNIEPKLVAGGEGNTREELTRNQSAAPQTHYYGESQALAPAGVAHG